ncbi:MAG TPA: hypothetical protein VIT67_08815, partial [Povalibacter sp.]
MNRYLLPFLAFALLGLTALVYMPGLSGGFIFDDYPNIVTNQAVQPESLSWEGLRRAASAYQPGAYGRPLATISFAIDYLIGGKDAWQFKLTGLLVHLINASLVFWLLLRLFALPGIRNTWHPIAAAAIALFWATNPQQVSSVLYVVQRMETLSLTFVLLALIAYLRGRTQQLRGERGWPWLAASVLLAGIGMLSKETAALFPAYALALELTVLGFESRSARTTRLLKAAYALGLALAAIAFVFWVLPQYTAPNAFAGRDFTLTERLLTQLRVLPMYIGQILLPLPSALTFYYDALPKSTGWLSPATTLLGGLFLLSLLVCAWLLRRRLPVAALGVLWFFAAHLLTSNVFNLELAFEHRNYFALLGVVLVVADLVRLIPMRDGPALKYIAVGAVLLGFGAMATVRSATWGNELHLAMEMVSKYPDSPRASNDLATTYVGMSDSNPESPFYSMGAAEFERASLLPSSSPLPEQGLILMAATTGQPVKAEWWDRLIHKINTRPIGPQENMAVIGLMNQRYRGIELDDKRLTEAFTALLRRQPTANLSAQFGDYALRYLGDEAMANKAFTAAVDLANKSTPDFAQKLAA